MVERLPTKDVPNVSEPTHEECAAGSEGFLPDGRRLKACFFPQISGWEYTCTNCRSVLVFTPGEDIFTAMVWNSPRDGDPPSVSLCSVSQFAEFARAIAGVKTRY